MNSFFDCTSHNLAAHRSKGTRSPIWLVVEYYSHMGARARWNEPQSLVHVRTSQHCRHTDFPSRDRDCHTPCEHPFDMLVSTCLPQREIRSKLVARERQASCEQKHIPCMSSRPLVWPHVTTCDLMGSSNATYSSSRYRETLSSSTIATTEAVGSIAPDCTGK